MSKVSIVIPCYNAEKYIEETITSALESDYIDFEIVIVNDGSTDNSESIIKQYLEKYDCIRYFKIANQGPAVARNIAIENSVGTYILPLDADDKISKDYLTLATQYLDSSAETKLVYAEAEFFGKKNGKWDLPVFKIDDFAFGNLIYSTAFFRKSDWQKLGGYDSNLRYGFEDWEFWIRLLKDGGKVYRIPKICFFYRITDLSRSVSIDSGIQLKETYNYIFKKHADFVIQYLPNKLITDKLNTDSQEIRMLKRKILVKLAIFLSGFWKKLKTTTKRSRY